MTWNVENFPKNDQVTVAYMAEIIQNLDIDLIALQEIESNTYFNLLLDFLPGWSGYKANTAGYNIDLAYIYNENAINATEIYEIYQANWYEFPRNPLVMEFEYEGEELIIINNHLKAGGDDEDEERRRLASLLLEEYIEVNFSQDKVFIVGDLNDEIDESAAENVFWNFIEQPDSYQFVDMGIAEGSHIYWSYPTWPSHLDHILVTNELFDGVEFIHDEILTIRLDNFLNGGWNEYENNLSDHRPVAFRLHINNK